MNVIPENGQIAGQKQEFYHQGRQTVPDHDGRRFNHRIRADSGEMTGCNPHKTFAVFSFGEC